jgi:hypothetical protein
LIPLWRPCTPGYVLNYHRIFDAGNDLDGTTAFTAGFDVYVENTLQSLRPAHVHVAFGGCLFLRLIGRFGLVALAPPGGYHPRTVFAVGGKHAVIIPSGRIVVFWVSALLS